MIRIELAGVHQVDQVWPDVAAGLELACRNTGGDLTSDYLWTECRGGKAFLAVIGEAGIIGASVWRFENWSTGKKLRCLAMYGERMSEWQSQHRKLIEDMARVGGATALVTEGRKGFERVFPEAKVLRQLYQVDL